MIAKGIQIGLVGVSLLVGNVWAEESKDDIPAAKQQGLVGEEGIQPEVTIIRKKNSTVEEYRIRGRLYMIRVIPAKGEDYYLLDRDGDGELESRRDELDPSILVPSWILFSW